MQHPQILQRPPPPPPSAAVPLQPAPLYPSQAIAAESPASPPPAPKPAGPVTISAEPKLRDLQKELLNFVPASIRRKQLGATKKQVNSKPAPANVEGAPSIDGYDEQEQEE